jgi:hypothetical protein
MRPALTEGTTLGTVKAQRSKPYPIAPPPAPRQHTLLCAKVIKSLRHHSENKRALNNLVASCMLGCMYLDPDLDPVEFLSLTGAYEVQHKCCDTSCPCNSGE